MVLIDEKRSQMLKEMRECHRWCCVKLLSDYDYVWDVVLYEAERRNQNPEHKPTIKSGSYENLNDAIESAYKQAQEYRLANPVT